MTLLAIIGGTGALSLVPDHATRDSAAVRTPFGQASAPLLRWQRGSTEVVLLPRHGDPAVIAPHEVNYRANVSALADLKPELVMGINAVGGIHADALPGNLVLANQLIDYTWGREQTFGRADGGPVRHVEFTDPVSPIHHVMLGELAAAEGLRFCAAGTCGVTQGPRLETAAEIDRLERDGCDVVGMTALPEACLAAERGVPYVMCGVVVNAAAGRGSGSGIHAEIHAHIQAGMGQAARLIDALLDAW